MVKTIIHLAGALARIAGEKTVELEAENLGGALEALAQMFGEDLERKLFDENGIPRRFFNIYIDGREYRLKDGIETKLSEGSSISIIPAVSGG